MWESATHLENTELNTCKLFFLILEFLRAFNIYSMNLQGLVESEGFTKFIRAQKIIFLEILTGLGFYGIHFGNPDYEP